MNNVTFASGMVDEAFEFNGHDSYVRISHDSNLNPSGAFSVDAWIKADPEQYSRDGLFVVIDKSHGFIDGTGWVVQGTQGDPGCSISLGRTCVVGEVMFGFGKGGNTGAAKNFVGVGTMTNVLDDQWHHITGVYTGSEIRMYLDGVLKDSRLYTGDPVNNDRDVYIGRHGVYSVRHFHGLIDEVEYFNRALSGEEVQALYLSGSAGKCKSENTPPTANAGTDQTVECAGPEGASVTLDGSGSTDPDGDALTYAWTWDGGSAEGVSPSVTLPYGTTTVFLTVSDGEFEDSDEVDIAIEDTTPPSTSAILEGELGNNGWYVSDVDVELTAADSCTGVRDVHYTITGPGHNGSETVVEDSRANFTLNADGSYTVTYWAVDNAGNVEVIDTGNVEGVNREYNPPSVTPVLPPEPPSGYYTECVTVKLNTTDSASGGAATEYWNPVQEEWKPYDDTVGIPVCSTTTVKYRSTSPAGNVHYNTVVINIDQTPPTITAVVEPPANANGWHNTDVTVTFTCNDATSGVAECTSPVSVSTEGAGQVVTGTAVDKAGNAATTSVTLNIDKTAPVADISVTPGILWPPNHKTVDVAVNGEASDPSSGVASVEFTVADDYGTVEPLVSGFNTTISLEAWRNGGDRDGRHYTITAVITDNAGNRTTVTTEAVVPHDMRGKK